MAVSQCVISFIRVVLCGNPIMKGAFVTILNSMIVQLDQEVATLNLEIGRLNLLNRALNIEIQALQAIFNKVQADLNLILGPLSSAPGCADLQRLSEELQKRGLGKQFTAFQRNVYKLNRVTNLIRLQQTISKEKDDLRNRAQDFVNKIAELCG